MDMSLFKTLEINEIPQIISRAAHFGGVIEQPTLTSSRVTLIKQMTVDNAGLLRIELYDDFESEEERHIKIKLKYRKLFFHLMPGQFRAEGKTLVASLPRDARALAMRDTDRYLIPKESAVLSSIYRTERRGGNCNIQAQLFDVSRQGMAFLIEQIDNEVLVKNDHVWIKTMNGTPLEKPLFGRIVYVSGGKIGISLEAPLSEDIFQELQEKSHMVRSA